VVSTGLGGKLRIAWSSAAQDSEDNHKADYAGGRCPIYRRYTLATRLYPASQFKFLLEGFGQRYILASPCPGKP
jgi:hypothetical protein